MSTDTHALELRGVTKFFESFELGPIDLELERGYVMALVGSNGSGKSTLFRLLMNQYPPDKGEVFVRGRRYRDGEVKIRQRIGFVPDAAIGHDEMNAIQLNDFLSHWYPTWDRQCFYDLLTRFEIDPKKRIGNLSRGMQRRVMIACAFAFDSDLLLLDEPTANLDPFAVRAVLDEISAYMDGGDRAVLIATHSMDEVRRIADYVAFLHRGQLLGVFEKDALLDSWKEIWVERLPEGAEELPGVVAVEPGVPGRLVTKECRATEQSLLRELVPILKVQTLELDEILAYLMPKRRREGRR